MTVQLLRGGLDRIAGEGALQDGEHAVSLLAFGATFLPFVAVLQAGERRRL